MMVMVVNRCILIINLFKCYFLLFCIYIYIYIYIYVCVCLCVCVCVCVCVILRCPLAREAYIYFPARL